MAIVPSTSMPEALILELEGHLTRAGLLEKLEVIGEQLSTASDRRPLVVNALTMSGYDSDARAAFVEWNKKHRAQISRVAVVTEKRLWHMVVAAMALASGQDIKAFFEIDAAVGWARN